MEESGESDRYRRFTHSCWPYEDNWRRLQWPVKIPVQWPGFPDVYALWRAPNLAQYSTSIGDAQVMEASKGVPRDRLWRPLYTVEAAAGSPIFP